ncbi:hypothetical protein AUJ65_02255 [Candidatus Micrarchaeota archaeon CG1_02_51_15]|nr:MAG: hypothetical protein AUJ65_02255 [Candidatus Micrarchaeota archaeon CG1_02_51_15]
MIKKLLFAISLILFAAVILYAGPSVLLDALISADPLPLAVATFLIAVTIGLNGIRFHILTSSIGELPFKQTFNVLLFSQLANQGAIALLGDATKAVLFKKLFGHSFTRIIGIVTVERGQDLLVALTCAVLLAAELSWAGYAAFGVMAVFCALMIFVFTPPSWIRKLPFKRLSDAAQNFREGVRAITLKTILQSFAVTLAALITGGLANQLLLASFGVSLPLLTVVTVTSVSLLAGLASGLPAGLGAREASLVLMYGSFGVPASAVLMSALLLRVIFASLSYAGYLATRTEGQNNTYKTGHTNSS